MACINPRTFRNPTTHYKPGYDAAQIVVPCQQCEGCLRDIRDEWAIRSYYEFVQASKVGGFTLFVTLTYNEANIPIISKVSRFNVDSYCFNYYHIKNLIHSLRKSLKDRLGLEKDVFTYLICSEYGEDPDGTHRSHYHGLFHCKSDRVPPSWFLGRIRDLWSQYGFVHPKNNNDSSAIVTSFAAEKYTSKYVCKDLNFFNKPEIHNLLYTDNRPNTFIKKELSHFLPRHYQSKGYGSYLYDLIVNNSEPFQFINNGIRPLFTQDVYRVPRYILNRLKYSYCPQYDEETGEVLRDENGRVKLLRYLNSFGKKYLSWKLVKNVTELSNRFAHDLSYIGLSGKFNNMELQLFISDPDCTVASFSDELHNLLGNRSYRDLAIFAICGQGRELPYHDLLNFVPLNKPDDLYHYMVKHFLEFEKLDHSAFPTNIVPENYLTRKILLDTSPMFSNMSALLSLYNKLKNFHMKKELDRLAKEKKNQDRIRSFYKPH